jgi:hypothetical protein
MKKDTLLVQCVLKNDRETDVLQTVAWIEAEKARLGHWILSSDVKSKEDPKWWQIFSIGTEKIPYEKLAIRKDGDIWDNPVNQMRGNK